MLDKVHNALYTMKKINKAIQLSQCITKIYRYTIMTIIKYTYAINIKVTWVSWVVQKVNNCYHSANGSSDTFTAGLLVSESGYLEKCLVSSIPLRTLTHEYIL